MTDEIKKAKYGDKEFTFDAGMTLEQAKSIMARHFPELAEPNIETKVKGDTTTYIFTKRVGQKGADLVGQLLALNPTPIVPAAVQPLIDNAMTNRITELPDADYREYANELNNEAREVERLILALDILTPATKPMGSVLL